MKNEQDLETNTPPAQSLEKHSDLELAWSDLVYVAPKRQQPILNHLTGSARSGELLAGESEVSFLSLFNFVVPDSIYLP
jgi:hypothetical protein